MNIIISNEVTAQMLSRVIFILLDNLYFPVLSPVEETAYTSYRNHLV